MPNNQNNLNYNEQEERLFKFSPLSSKQNTSTDNVDSKMKSLQKNYEQEEIKRQK